MEFLMNLWLLAGLVVLLLAVIALLIGALKFYSDNFFLYLFCGGQHTLEMFGTVIYYVVIALVEVLKALCGSKE